jgi:hypothetical protein
LGPKHATSFERRTGGILNVDFSKNLTQHSGEFQAHDGVIGDSELVRSLEKHYDFRRMVTQFRSRADTDDRAYFHAGQANLGSGVQALGILKLRL